MASCVSCGAPNEGDGHYFVCGFCGSQNTSEEYFKASAKEALRRANSGTKSIALSAFESGDYRRASELFEKEIESNADDVDAWKYYIVARAAIIETSNFSSECSYLSDCLRRLPEEVREEVGIDVSQTTLGIAFEKVDGYYVRALSRHKNDANPIAEIEKGFELLIAALDLPNYASAPRFFCLCVGKSMLLSLEDWRVDDVYVDQLNHRIREEFEKISHKKLNPELTVDFVERYSSRHPRLANALSEKFPELKSVAGDSSSGGNGKVWLLAAIIGLAVVFLLF